MRVMFLFVFFVLACSCVATERAIEQWVSEELEKISGMKLVVRDFYVQVSLCQLYHIPIHED